MNWTIHYIIDLLLQTKTILRIENVNIWCDTDFDKFYLD